MCRNRVQELHKHLSAVPGRVSGPTVTFVAEVVPELSVSKTLALKLLDFRHQLGVRLEGERARQAHGGSLNQGGFAQVTRTVSEQAALTIPAVTF